MRKSIIFVLTIIMSTCLMAGVITDPVGDKSTGDSLTATEFNDLKNAILNEVNGNLDSANIKASSIVTEDILNDAVTPAKIDEDATDSYVVANATITYGVRCSTLTVTSTATLTGAAITNMTVGTVNSTISCNYGISVATITVSSHTLVEVYLSGDAAIPTSADTCIAFNAETYDNLQEFNTTTSSFTAKVSGLYMVVLQTNANTDEGDYHETYIYHNSTIVGKNQLMGATGVASHTLQATAIVKITAGDTIAGHFYHTHGSDRNLGGGANPRSKTYMSIIRIY